MSEHQVKMKRLKNLFFTSATWENIGGLAGLCMSLGNAGIEVSHYNQN